MNNQGTCTHEFLNGPNKGTVCGDIAIVDGYCQSHLKLSAPRDDLGNFGTCSYRFVAGPRAGLYCAMSALGHGEPCEVHQRITDDTNAGKQHCAHKYNGGIRKGCYCTRPVEIQGKCWSHHMATAVLDAPHGTDCDPDYGPNPTCKYQFTCGVRADKYCPHNAGESGYCYKHRDIPHRPEKAKKEKKTQARTPKTPCAFIMRGGKRSGQHCGKLADAETKLCKSHSHHKGKCLQVDKVVIIKYHPCHRKVTKGTDCGMHHKNTSATSAESDSE